ncbi:MAG: NADH:quinone oxidoreductase [Porticoccaceae bacterium]|nr:NADH:quinone oxidoreductase [Porticoccaceae bacterium]
MTDTLLFYLLVASFLWAAGLHGLIVARHVLRRVIAVNIMTAGVFLALVTLAARAPEPDPVLHALVLTGLVISVSATALALHLGTAAFSTEKPEPTTR